MPSNFNFFFTFLISNGQMTYPKVRNQKCKFTSFPKESLVLHRLSAAEKNSEAERETNSMRQDLTTRPLLSTVLSFFFSFLSFDRQHMHKISLSLRSIKFIFGGESFRVQPLVIRDTLHSKHRIFPNNIKKFWRSQRGKKTQKKRAERAESWKPQLASPLPHR